MSIHSKSTDPWTRARANKLLREAGYKVSDPFEETPFGRWADAQAHYAGQFQQLRQLSVILLVSITVLLTAFLALPKKHQYQVVLLPNGQPMAVSTNTK